MTESKKEKIKRLLKAHRLEAVDTPRFTHKHPIYKAIVLADLGDDVRIIRFGAQGYGHNYSDKARAAFKSRHAKNIARGAESGAFWSDYFLWTKGWHTRRP